MPLNVPDVGENAILEMIVNKTSPQNLVLELFQNNITPLRYRHESYLHGRDVYGVFRYRPNRRCLVRGFWRKHCLFRPANIHLFGRFLSKHLRVLHLPNNFKHPPLVRTGCVGTFLHHHFWGRSKTHPNNRSFLTWLGRSLLEVGRALASEVLPLAQKTPPALI